MWKSVAFAAAAVPLLGALAAPADAAGLPVEEQMSTTKVADFEFDWARTGVYCASCNAGHSNAQVSFTDRTGNLWVGGIDFQTGQFNPADLKGEVAGTRAAFMTDFGNGATWTISQAGSMLAFTRYADGLPQTPDNAGVAMAQRVNGVWTQAYLPNAMNRAVPKGTVVPTDAVARLTYGSSTGYTVYSRDVSSTSKEVRIPFVDPYHGLSLRWVDGTHTVIFAAPGAPDSTGQVYTQIFTYDTDRPLSQPEQLTFDSSDKRMAFMWAAPEYGGASVFFTVVDGTRFEFYRKMPDANGKLQWTRFLSLPGFTGLPYIGGSPEAFVYNGRSYVIFAVRADPDWSDITKPTQLAITGMDPANPGMRLLTNDQTTDSARWRSDPEYFITAQTAYVYYTRCVPQTSQRPPVNEGIWRMDLGLGPRTTASTP